MRRVWTCSATDKSVSSLPPLRDTGRTAGVTGTLLPVLFDELIYPVCFDRLNAGSPGRAFGTIFPVEFFSAFPDFAIFRCFWRVLQKEHFRGWICSPLASDQIADFPGYSHFTPHRLMTRRTYPLGAMASGFNM